MRGVTEIDGSWSRVPGNATGWLAELDPDHGSTGFEPPRRPDAAWLLHAMYVWEDGPVATTHDHVHRSVREAGLADGSPSSDAPAERGVEALLAGAVVTGTGLGRSGHPGPGWRRLRWSELADRLGEPPVPQGEYPGRRCLRAARPTGSWSAAIEPPAEGGLDREGWRRLVQLLALHSPAGSETRCRAFYSPLLTADWEHETVLAGRLGDAVALYDHPGMPSCPTNFWAEDRSWVVHCHWDLWGTKVAGPRPLVRDLLGDPDLEALRLPWTS
ncbi:hypothetical protein GQS52_12340 [Streptomyces sp. SCUT-3]|uniref:hypothetical protein n=1 Tax=Streptomyces sp. SCUT-3 TaxID=2684469 RepID=UPI0015FEAC53|nr:hypothetical protein [Streptomyces sp. SCUT-3]QMV22444.1 hypothetical protein GQS52_12340 [Streptomyces sp. SCUT-3]